MYTHRSSIPLVIHELTECYSTRKGELEKLTNSIGRQVVGYLNKFPVLENPVDIAAWKEFCEKHPSKELCSTFYIPNFLKFDPIIQINNL